MVFVESNNFSMGHANGDWQGLVNAIGQIIRLHDDKIKASVHQFVKDIDNYGKDLTKHNVKIKDQMIQIMKESHRIKKRHQELDNLMNKAVKQ